MKLINDIRFGKSHIEKMYGVPTGDIKNKKFYIIIERIVMKLREINFSFGDYIVIFINFVTYHVDGKMSLSKREVDKFHPWYRVYDVQINRLFYLFLDKDICVPFMIKIVEQLLIKFFSSNEIPAEMIHNCVEEAVNKGEKMLMKYIEKISSNRKAMLYLRKLDSGEFYPLLLVYDKNDNLLLKKDLPKARDLLLYGSIQLNSNTVKIIPKKDLLTKDLLPMTFTL